MPDTGAKYPGTVTTQSVAPSEINPDWTNPNNIKASDNNYATAIPVSVIGATYRLKAQNFDFSAIPAGATINGILVEIEHKAGTANRINDYHVQLLDASGNPVGNDKGGEGSGPRWPNTDTIASYGGAADTWSASPTRAMVQDIDFGVYLSANDWWGLGGVTAYVDCIRITVYYTVAASHRKSSFFKMF